MMRVNRVIGRLYGILRGDLKRYASTVYILNTPVLTDWGEYVFRPISVDEALELLEGGFVSAVGHEGTAQVLSQLLGVKVPVSRIQIRMNVGDKALVFRILTRLPEGKILTEEELKKLPWTIGLLERVR